MLISVALALVDMQEHPGGAEIILCVDDEMELDLFTDWTESTLERMPLRSTRYVNDSHETEMTADSQPIHPPDAITDNLDPSKHLGPIEPGTLAAPPPPEPPGSAPPPASVPVGQTSANATQPEEYVKPHLEQILSLHDFEAVARRTMNRRGWNYYSSGADDEITLRENHNAYGRVWFRPRVLRNVSQVDFSTSIFGFKTSMPVYITATALGVSFNC